MSSVSYHLGAVIGNRRALWRYWRASSPPTHRALCPHYAALIGHATQEHGRFIDIAGAGSLIRKTGIRMLYRSGAAFAAACDNASRLQREYGIAYLALDGEALARAEPDFRIRLRGALHWSDSWSVSDPASLVEQYFNAFQRTGGKFLTGDARTLSPWGAGWRVSTSEGPVQAPQVVIALGPWAAAFVHRFGYDLPLFVKRGYHRHYVGGGTVQVPTLDAERGYVMSPQQRGLRITTGAEIAAILARPTPVQLAQAEVEAKRLLNLGAPVENAPWLGSRPCVSDMLPVIGAAPKHHGIWFNFGHGHQGFTLGPASARLLADLIQQTLPYIPHGPYDPGRFR